MTAAIRDSLAARARRTSTVTRDFKAVVSISARRSRMVFKPSVTLTETAVSIFRMSPALGTLTKPSRGLSRRAGTR